MLDHMRGITRNASVLLIHQQATNGVRMEPAVEIDVTVVTKGRVDAEAVDYARQKIDKTLRHGATPARRAVIHLTHEPDPARERPFIAEATIDRDGEAIRAHVGGDAMLEAIDLLDDRLRRRIDESESRKRALIMRHRDDGPGEWRHGSVPAERPRHFVRPVDDREIIRHKSFTVAQQTIDEAVFDLETLDHDFFLFRDERTGADAVVWRLDGHYALIESDGSAPAPDTVADVEVRPIAVPTISVEAAEEILDGEDVSFVFFINEDTGRGNVVYWRYDGHYGLIEPAG
jgi:hypothetical protein